MTEEQKLRLWLLVAGIGAAVVGVGVVAGGIFVWTRGQGVHGFRCVSLAVVCGFFAVIDLIMARYWKHKINDSA